MRESKMKRSSRIVAVMVLLAGSCVAQKKGVTPPPKPEDNGPSLEATMNFIREKLNGLAPMGYVLYFHDNVAGTDWATQAKTTVSDVVADPSACRISYLLKIEHPGGEATNVNMLGAITKIKQIAVVPAKQWVERTNAADHPSWAVTVSPPFFVVEMDGPFLPLYDEELANRLAKAITHAVELCGGGSAPEPF